MLTFWVSHISARVSTSCFFLTYHNFFFSSKNTCTKKFCINFNLQVLNGRIQFLLDHLRNVTYAFVMLWVTDCTSHSHSCPHCLKPTHSVFIRSVFFLVAHILFYQSKYLPQELWPQARNFRWSPPHVKFCNRHKCLKAKHGYLGHSHAISLGVLGSCG